MIRALIHKIKMIHLGLWKLDECNLGVNQFNWIVRCRNCNLWCTCWWIPNGYNLLIRNIIMQSFATKICLDFIMQCRAIFPTGGRSTSIEIGMNRAKMLWLINIQPTLCLVSMFNIAAFVQSNRGKSISYACLTPIVLVLIKLFAMELIGYSGTIRTLLIATHIIVLSLGFN